jgi:hypothetical protein
MLEFDTKMNVSVAVLICTHISQFRVVASPLERSPPPLASRSNMIGALSLSLGT